MSFINFTSNYINFLFFKFHEKHHYHSTNTVWTNYITSKTQWQWETSYLSHVEAITWIAHELVRVQWLYVWLHHILSGLASTCLTTFTFTFNVYSVLHLFNQINLYIKIYLSNVGNSHQDSLSNRNWNINK